MKLREIPSSLYHSLKLISKPISAFKEDTKTRIPVVVSLTSIPSRIKTLHITIRSLLDQNVLPKKIVLWLNDSLKNSIPNSLLKLEGSTFEIRFSPYTFSHRKLIHSLEAFPKDIIITCDDDVIYQPNSLQLLYKESLENPRIIIGNRCRYITLDDYRKPLPYKQWLYSSDETNNNKKLFMPVGAFLVLYPPKTLNEKYNDVTLINKLAPKSDDLWFKTMALLNGTNSLPSKIKKPDPIPILGTQFISLKHVNVKLDLNRKQLEQLIHYFKLEF